MIGEAIFEGICIGLKIGSAIIGATLCIAAVGCIASIIVALLSRNDDEDAL